MAMTFYTGWQYLLIDAASHFGLDKLRFEERIQWSLDHLHELESLAEQADSKPLYLKAVMAIRKAQKGIPTGHPVGVDASCSGIQIMSVLTGCVSGARSTGLVDPDRRADAYSECTTIMNKLLDGNLEVSRKEAKQALMTSFYGSKAQPKALFGEGTPELAAFYEAAQTMAPGAWDLLQTLLASWNPEALMHSWVLPDGFDARIKVMLKKSTRIKVDELDQASFTYEYYANEPVPVGHVKSKANAANVVHSMDAYVLREMHRRCNYDRLQAEDARELISIALISRGLAASHTTHQITDPKIQYYVDQYNRSSVASIVILPYLNHKTILCLESDHLNKLLTILTGMLQYQPFELITIHDEFKAHPNNLNWVRWQYKEILAEVAESNVLDDILSQLYGVPGDFEKYSNNLSDLIRNSNYALC